MKLMFLPLSVGTHVTLQIPLAWACRAAGHEVLFVTEQAGVGQCNRAGFPSRTVGGGSDFQKTAIEFFNRLGQQGPAAMQPEYGPAEAWIKTAQATAGDLVAHVRQWQPDLLIADSMTYAAPVASENLGVPMVRTLWGPDWPATGLGLGGFSENQRQQGTWPQTMLDLYATYGAEPERDYAEFTIDQFPPGFSIDGLVNAVPMRHVPFNGPGLAPSWLAEGRTRRRVCVTWGTTTTTYLGGRGFHVPAIVDALRTLDVDVVLLLSARDRAMLGTIPDDVRCEVDVPLEDVVEHCDLMVSQGGASGIMAALTRGSPMVLVPQFADQPTNARLIEEFGAGVVVDGNATFDAALVAAGVQRCLEDPRIGQRAEELAARWEEMPAPAQLVPALEGVAAGGASRR